MVTIPSAPTASGMTGDVPNGNLVYAWEKQRAWNARRAEFESEKQASRVTRDQELVQTTSESVLEVAQWLSALEKRLEAVEAFLGILVMTRRSEVQDLPTDLVAAQNPDLEA